MFWSKKNKLPITQADKAWIDEDLNWLRTEFGEDHFMEIQTITPTKNFYNRIFEGNEEDAEFILNRTMELMKIEDVDIELDFFSDSPVEMSDGKTLTSPADIEGKWSSASGTFQQINDKVIISIEREQLKNTVSLIATIAHELSHQILLGEGRINENDEFLTDLTAITYGYGIFLGNSRFSFSSFSNGFESGWQSSSQGYLPEQIIAYAMAWLSRERKESTYYSKYLNKSMTKYLNQSFNYLRKE